MHRFNIISNYDNLSKTIVNLTPSAPKKNSQHETGTLKFNFFRKLKKLIVIYSLAIAKKGLDYYYFYLE